MSDRLFTCATMWAGPRGRVLGRVRGVGRAARGVVRRRPRAAPVRKDRRAARARRHRRAGRGTRHWRTTRTYYILTIT